MFSAHRLVLPAGTHRFEAAINAVDVGEVRLIYMKYAAPVEVVAKDSLGYYSVHIPLRGGGSVDFGREHTETDPHTGVVFSPSDKPRMLWRGNLGQLAVKIPESAVREHLQMLTAEPVRDAVSFDHRMSGQTDEHQWANLLRMVVGIVDQQQTRGLSPVLARQLENMLLSGLLLTQPHNYSETLTSPVSAAAPRAIAEAAELLRACPEHPWTVGELAARTGVSARSIQEGFRRQHGTTPTRFLRDVRLDRARALLLERLGPRTLSITDLAHELGFSNVGRFAAAYRERFGVNPSQHAPGPG